MPCICPQQRTAIAQNIPSNVRLCIPKLPSCAIDNHPDLPACAGCGRCCHLVVELREGDWVPAEFIVEHAGARCMDQQSNGACIALDPRTQLCTIYDDRPQTCRDFNRGESLCRHILSQRAPGVV